MPVTTQVPRNSYTGNNSTTVFVYQFRIIDEADIKVFLDGVEQTISTHYTVSGVGDTAGGSVTFLVAPGTDVTVVLERDIALVQTLDLTEGGALPSQTLDDVHDRLVMMVQDLDNRAFQRAVGADTLDALSLRVINVEDPVDPQDAATKAYVDAEIVGAGNVPAPDDPGDNNKTLIASGGLFSWQTIGTNQIQNLAVTTGKIAADAIDSTKVADDAIDSEHIVDGAIDTVHIGDDQITLGKMASGTANRLLGYDGSGDPAELTRNLELVEYADLTNGGANDLTSYVFSHAFQDGYEYEVVGREVSGTETTWLAFFQVAAAGPTWRTTSYIQSGYVVTGTGINNNATAGFVPYYQSAGGNIPAANWLTFKMSIYGIGSSARFTTTIMDSQQIGASVQARSITSAAYNGAQEAHVALRCNMSVGTFDKGELFLYRIKEPS